MTYRSVNPLLLIPGVVAAGLTLAWLSATVHGQIAVRNQGFVPFSDEPINYRGDVHDPVAQLQDRLDRGDTTLDWEPRNSYLKSVLDHLKISVSSQTLVFSKTSFQYKKITPQTPRALYFNADVYVGKVHDGKAIEIISFDARQGAIFYLLDEHQVERPTFQRAELDCTVCHVAAGTRNVPGVLIRSIFTTPTGTQVDRTPAYFTGNQSPLSERFGGWYVTGTHGAQTHMGNVSVQDRAHPDVLDRDAGANVTNLASRLDTAAYLSPHSDIVAQLVQAHQTQMHNLITQTNYQTRIALYEEAAKNRAAGLPEGALSDAARAKYERPAEELVRYLIFADEAPLEAEVKGTSGFAGEFAARGPRDSHGRSLRDFDLQTRLFKYRVSYLIYTDAFDALPEPARSYVSHRLLEILKGSAGTDEFWDFATKDRQAALEILRRTKPNLPDEWQPKTRHVPSDATASSNRNRLRP
jgi:hypothetical protein